LITVGDHFPGFEVSACVSTQAGQEFATIDHKTHEGQWRVVFFWPMDFTAVCPTEIVAFSALEAAFAERGTQLLGVSTDTEYVHLAWRQSRPDLADLPFPMLADTKRELSEACGVLGDDGVAQRATFIVDADNVVQFSMVNSGDVGRNVDEVLRVLDALQTGASTPCGWSPGDTTL
jgi:peroxiredoxin (alkyl hydroperoxide reductase subunit C)